MRENKFILISFIILAASIFFGSMYLGKVIRSTPPTVVNPAIINPSVVNSTTASYDKGLMSEEETADYLGMTLEKFNDLLMREDYVRKQMSTYDTFRFVPFIKIDGIRYFNKAQVNKWIEYNSINRADINTKER